MSAGIDLLPGETTVGFDRGARRDRIKQFTDEQIIGILKEAEAGGKTTEPCRQPGISEQTFWPLLAPRGSVRFRLLRPPSRPYSRTDESGLGQ